MANHHGDFIWYELLTSDSKSAEAFYGPLLGWRFHGGDDYREIEASEGDIGGMLQLTPEMTSGGARPAWLGYILVDDVDQMVESVGQGGGTVLMPARTMAGVGRFALVADPQGAAFYVMKPQPPADRPDLESFAFSYDRPRHGHCAWNELATSDVEGAHEFYGQRFGWVKDGAMEMGGLGSYQFLRHEGRAPQGSPMGRGMLGAIYRKPAEMPVSAWSFYFRVPDIDAAVRYVRGGGGKMLVEPTEIPGGDFSMMAIDPQGAHFALVGGRSR
jgi:predicted enzyme related to lactoylglutathione lyase